MTAARPNILWFIADDTGFGMLGHSGGPPVTPHTDRLAREGVVCSNFHTCSPICTPSRYGYFTGTYPARCQAPRFLRIHPQNEPCVLGFENEIMPGTPNFGSVFQAAGYFTGMVGKFHIGGPRGALAGQDYAPDENPEDPATASKLRADYAAMQAYFRSLGFDYADGLSWDNTDNRPVAALRQHNLEWQTAHVFDFLGLAARSGRPFALHCGFTTQHGPHHARSLATDGRATEWGLLDRMPDVQTPRAGIRHRIRAAGCDPDNHIVAGAAWQDDAIGCILRRLEELGLAGNTIVVVSTDHGPGTRSGKFTCYQGGAHIPFVLHAPGRVAHGSRCDALLQNIDLLPTLCGFAGIPAPAGLDGLDRAAQILGHAADDRDALYFELGRCRGVRTRRHKYIAFRHRAAEIDAMKAGTTEGAYLQVRGVGGDYPLHLYPHYWDADQLYDLETDPTEQRNLLHADGTPRDRAHAPLLDDLCARLAVHLATFPHPFPMRADPFTATPAYRALARLNAADTSIYDSAWYRDLAW